MHVAGMVEMVEMVERQGARERMRKRLLEGGG